MKLANPHPAYLLFILALLVVASPNAAEKTGEARGQELAQTHCARCHATGADDASAHPSAPRFRDLHRRWPVETLQEALTEGLMTGHPDMPEFQFTSEEAAAFVTYLETLAPKTAPTEPARSQKSQGWRDDR